MSFPFIAAHAFNTPLLVEPRKAAAFASGLGARITGAGSLDLGSMGEYAANPPEAANQPFASLLDDAVLHRIKAGRENKYPVVQGVAIIAITGVLIHRGGWVGNSSGQTSYEGISAQIEMAKDDPEVRAVALEIDSFGGLVAGCFDLADQIRALREVKQVVAFVAEHSFSAGYAIASQASKIIVPRTGGVGSIGVVMMHVDHEKAIEAAGARVTLIHAGSHKVDGNSYQALPDDVRDKFKTNIEATRQLFAETVAAGRGDRLDVKAALATEAACFSGQDAVDAGLADAVAAPRAAFKQFVSELNGRGNVFTSLFSTNENATKEGATVMKPKGKDGKEAADVDDQTPAPEASTDGGEGSSAPEAENAESVDVGGTAASPAVQDKPVDERARIKGIQTSEAAKGREDLASHFAFDTDMSVEAAVAALEKAPKALAGKSPLSKAMGGDSDTLEGASEEDAPLPNMAAAMSEKLKTSKF
jgi:signal peptide peptidase SppA